MLDKYVDIKPSRKTQSSFDKGPRNFPSDFKNIQTNCGAKSTKANITFAIANISSEKARIKMKVIYFKLQFFKVQTFNKGVTIISYLVTKKTLFNLTNNYKLYDVS